VDQYYVDSTILLHSHLLICPSPWLERATGNCKYVLTEQMKLDSDDSILASLCAAYCLVNLTVSDYLNLTVETTVNSKVGSKYPAKINYFC
jgi:hypothetical protein